MRFRRCFPFVLILLQVLISCERSGPDSSSLLPEALKKPDVREGHRVVLNFEGIDCIADFWMNGKKIAHVDNMFVEHHYDITDLLEEKNQLYICIFSSVLEARKHLRNNFGVRYDALAEAVSVRKAPHMFGWDILVVKDSRSDVSGEISIKEAPEILISKNLLGDSAGVIGAALLHDVLH